MRITAKAVNRYVKKQTKIIAGFPDLFSTSAKKYMVTDTLIKASDLLDEENKKNTSPKTPEDMANIVNGAVELVIQKIVADIPIEVNNVIDEHRSDILDTFITEQTEYPMQEPQPIETLPVGSPTLQDMQQAQELSDEAPVAPMAASMDPKLKYAFRGIAQQLDPQVVQDTWVIVDGPHGTETIRADDVDLNEIENLMDRMESGEQVNLQGTTLGEYAANDVAWYLDITTGFGARVVSPVGDGETAWRNFDTKNDAWDYLNNLAEGF